MTVISVAFQSIVIMVSGILADRIGRVKPFLFIHGSIFLVTLICFIIMPKTDECGTKKITFYCLDQEIKAPDSCQYSQISFYADSCSLIYKENAVHSIENEKCPLISLLLQRDYSIENCHMNETSGFCLHRANFRNYSSKDMPPCEIQNCKALQMICSDKDPSSYCLKNRSFWILIYGIFVVLYNTSRSTVFTFFDVITMDLCNQELDKKKKEIVILKSVLSKVVMHSKE
ncbi:hypothetical protein AVEN_133898-1 [Araneus ventricosus]|uniref:Uncharacterized protein n=1 Tax=Araneus ventricosus TaxID=182803 RepID=A0A4Y2T2A6_ARAVE|nr:hypothetical protein AVEN_133898-1 [Araneus ventricosus]